MSLHTQLRWRAWMRWLVPVGALGVLVAVASIAQTSTSNAQCCLAAQSLTSTYFNPPVGEDNTFFRQAAGGDATLAFVLMNRKTMLGFPYSLYELRYKGGAGNPDEHSDANNDGSTATGCSNKFLNEREYYYGHVPAGAALAGRYSASRRYPAPEYTYADPATYRGNALAGLFDNQQYYTYQSWDNDSAPAQSAAAACDALSGVNGTPRRQECIDCLNSKGYYLNPNINISTNREAARFSPQAAAFSGNWLNFYPPRYILLRLALRKMIVDPRIARFRIATLYNIDDHGAVVSDKYRPACSASQRATPTTSFSQFLDTVPFTQESNPISEALFNTGELLATEGRWYGGSDQLFIDPGVSKIGSAQRDNICRDCEKNFVILFSDGRGDGANPDCASYVTSSGTTTFPAVCSRAMDTACNDATGAAFIEGDANDYVSAGRLTAVGGVPSTPQYTCAADVADDIARFLRVTDLGRNSVFPGVNNLETWVIGVGNNDHHQLEGLRAIAKAAAPSGTNPPDAQFKAATSFQDIEKALDDMLTQMIKRATSFSSAAVSTFQVNTGATAIIPRFQPDQTANWPGYLYRWGLFNEFVEDVDKNADGDKNDVFLVDPSGNEVVEDEDGLFVIKGTRTRATPYWEAGKALNDKVKAGGLSARTLYTVIDDQAPLGRIDDKDTRLRLLPNDDATAQKLLPYLNLGASDVCNRLGNGSTLTQLECAKRLINYVFGDDSVIDDDVDPSTTVRPWLLGDIFHSSPVLVLNPVDPFLCDMALDPQCLLTLYNTERVESPTPLTNYPEGHAYEKYRKDKLTRDRIILVGANDGMLHAFHAGAAKSESERTPTASNPYPETHTVGTGGEVWAFIPPDLLPKLQFRVNTRGVHHYYVDGDVMVRDIWVDEPSTGTPNKKEAEEFHTLAIVAERRGGNHYFSLDVTDPNDPRFRWVFPQPCDSNTLEVGETWMSVSPKPPPIGPVLLEKADGLSRTVKLSATAVTTANTEERWVTMLQGGYDPNLSRGRAVYMLDAYKGDLIYKHQFKAADASASAFRFPVAAPVAMVDYNSPSGGDGFFDTAVIPDTGGQVHVLRFAEPGRDTDGDGLVDNWYIARAFEQGSSTNSNLDERNPFFTMPSITIDGQTNTVRAYVGSGDRYNLRDQGAGQCQFDNPFACGKYDCTLDTRMSLTAGGQQYVTTTGISGSALGSVTEDGGIGDTCPSFSGRQTETLSGCFSTSKTLKDRRLSCTAGDGGYTCTNNELDGGVFDDSDIGTPSGVGEKNKFFAVHVYGKSTRFTDGGTSWREFGSSTEAATFDSTRLREADLVDVTAAGTAAPNALNAGWRLSYNTFPERTSTAPNIFGSCVLWSTFRFNPDGGTTATSACALSGSGINSTYQANIVTGAADCADSFRTGADGGYVRVLVDDTGSPRPPKPPGNPVVSISKEGGVRYSSVDFPPGGTPTNTNIQSSSDTLELIYSIDVPPTLHACRHQYDPATGVEGRCE